MVFLKDGDAVQGRLKINAFRNSMDRSYTNMSRKYNLRQGDL